MPESATAEIIQFPARQTAPEPAQAAVNPGEMRLLRALAELNNALTAQQVAVAAWKDSLGDLRSATSGLGDSMRNYNDRLTRLDDQVASLRTEAQKLETWADGVLASKG
jgi:hypothetical protein